MGAHLRIHDRALDCGSHSPLDGRDGPHPRASHALGRVSMRSNSAAIDGKTSSFRHSRCSTSIWCWPELFGFQPRLTGRLFDLPFASWAGVALCTAGLALFLAALVSFGNSFRVGIDADRPDRLVTSGIFGVTRNPIYVAFALMLVGQFLIFPHWLLLVYATVGFWLFHRQVRREEDFLQSHYGEDVFGIPATRPALSLNKPASDFQPRCVLWLYADRAESHGISCAGWWSHLHLVVGHLRSLGAHAGNVLGLLPHAHRQRRALGDVPFPARQEPPPFAPLVLDHSSGRSAFLPATWASGTRPSCTPRPATRLFSAISRRCLSGSSPGC